MINSKEILETIRMIQDECLDIRTTTMGISLLDCGDTDIDKSCQKIYDKICTKAEHLVSTGEQIEKEYGIPIINKRVSVTPIAIMAGISGGDPVKYALALEKAAQTIGVNFIGGYSALVQKGFAAGDLELINSIPRALAETEHICSSVNIGSTKAGINMNAVKIMGQKVKEAAELTKDNDCIAAGKLVVFCNAPEDNPDTMEDEEPKDDNRKFYQIETKIMYGEVESSGTFVVNTYNVERAMMLINAYLKKQEDDHEREAKEKGWTFERKEIHPTIEAAKPISIGRFIPKEFSLAYK